MAALKLSNKDLAKVVKAARSRGWQHVPPSGTGHTFLVHESSPGHRIPVASSPSDRNAAHHLRRRMRRCEEGRCEHGAPYPEVTR